MKYSVHTCIYLLLRLVKQRCSFAYNRDYLCIIHIMKKINLFEEMLPPNFFKLYVEIEVFQQYFSSLLYLHILPQVVKHEFLSYLYLTIIDRKTILTK